MWKRILIAAAIALVLGSAALLGLGWLAWHKMTGPLYVPGRMAAVTRSLKPPAQDQQPDDRWLVERDIELHHFALGSGPPVLFVHGGPGYPVREPMPWLARLAETNTIHFYDQRGCGDSTRPIDTFETENFYANMMRLDGALGLRANIADIERVRRILDVDRLTLIGHSFGGFITALYAAEFPDRVERLILLAPADMLVLPVEDDGLFGLVRERLPEDRRAAFEAFLDEYLDFGSLFEEDEASLARRNAELGRFVLEGIGRDPDAVMGPDATALTGGWCVQGIYMSMGRHHDYRDALAAITADTLVVHGGRDLQPVTVAKQYVELIPNARLLEVPDADHFFDGEHPELGPELLR